MEIDGVEIKWSYNTQRKQNVVCVCHSFRFISSLNVIEWLLPQNYFDRAATPFLRGSFVSRRLTATNNVRHVPHSNDSSAASLHNAEILSNKCPLQLVDPQLHSKPKNFIFCSFIIPNYSISSITWTGLTAIKYHMLHVCLSFNPKLGLVRMWSILLDQDSLLSSSALSAVGSLVWPVPLWLVVV